MNVIVLADSAAGDEPFHRLRWLTRPTVRNSTMVGRVGAGGIGGIAVLAFQRFRLQLSRHHPRITSVMIGEVLQIYVKWVFR